jgi:hypothetical protein
MKTSQNNSETAPHSEKAPQPERSNNLYEAPRPKLDPSQFKRSEDVESGFLDEGAELTVSLVKCPPQGVHVRIHPSPDYQWSRIPLLESKSTNELFLAMPLVEQAFRGDKFLAYYYLFFGVTEFGKLFGWALKTGQQHIYTESGRVAATAASKAWCRVDIQDFKYKARPAESALDFGEPVFPQATPEHVFNAIFDCQIAHDTDHPAARQLKGKK